MFCLGEAECGEAECKCLTWIEAVQAKRRLAPVHLYRDREYLQKALPQDTALAAPDRILGKPLLNSDGAFECLCLCPMTF